MHVASIRANQTLAHRFIRFVAGSVLTILFAIILTGVAGRSASADQLTLPQSWSTDDLALFKKYSAAVIRGDDSESAPEIVKWATRKVKFHITYIGAGTIDERFPKLNVALAWIEEQFNSVPAVSLEISKSNSAGMVAVNMLQPSIELYVVDQEDQVHLQNLEIQNSKETTIETERSYDTCSVARWSTKTAVVKAVGILRLTAQTASNVKCLSRTLLFGLGQNFAINIPAREHPYGVMTADPDFGLVLPNVLDTTLLKAVYEGDIHGGESRAKAIEYINSLQRAE